MRVRILMIVVALLLAGCAVSLGIGNSPPPLNSCSRPSDPGCQ